MENILNKTNIDNDNVIGEVGVLEVLEQLKDYFKKNTDYLITNK